MSAMSAYLIAESNSNDGCRGTFNVALVAIQSRVSKKAESAETVYVIVDGHFERLLVRQIHAIFKLPATIVTERGKSKVESLEEKKKSAMSRSRASKRQTRQGLDFLLSPFHASCPISRHTEYCLLASPGLAVRR